MATTPQSTSFSSEPQPAWEVALLFPFQGGWDEFDYLSLTSRTRQLVELVDGDLKVLPVPKTSHQFIVRFLFELLRSFVANGNLGEVVFAPLCVRIRPKLIREPDIVFMGSNHLDRIGEDYWSGADLVMEVVSPDLESHDRDYVKKRRDYAEAGIQEYWIVDPQLERITVLALDGKQYRVHGEFVAGERASSVLLSGFSADVAATFAAGKKPS